MLVKRGVTTIPGADDNLRDAGLTSLDMVNLMLAIEAEFDIEIPQSAMTPDNFDTVARHRGPGFGHRQGGVDAAGPSCPPLPGNAGRGRPGRAAAMTMWPSAAAP